jgi:hypothetical protein
MNLGTAFAVAPLMLAALVVEASSPTAPAPPAAVRSFAAGAARGFAAPYPGSRPAVWAQRIQRGLGAPMAGIGVWVLVPTAIGALAK